MIRLKLFMRGEQRFGLKWKSSLFFRETHPEPRGNPGFLFKQLAA